MASAKQEILAYLDGIGVAANDLVLERVGRSWLMNGDYMGITADEVIDKLKKMGKKRLVEMGSERKTRRMLNQRLIECADMLEEKGGWDDIVSWMRDSVQFG
jgi:hypothetical protein